MPTSPQKEEIAEIIEQVFALDYDIHVNEFQLKQLQRTVNRLLSKSACEAAQGQTALGFIAYHLGKIDDAFDHFKNTLQLQPRSPVVLSNYVFVCGASGQYRELKKSLKELVRTFPGDKDCLQCVIVQTVCIGHATSFFKYSEMHTKLTLNEPNPQPEFIIQSMDKLREIYREKNINEDHLIDLLESASQSVRNAGSEILNTNSLTLHDGTTIHYFYIDADLSACSEMDWVIAETLVENFEDSGMEYLSISCRPNEHFASSLHTIKI